MRPQGPRGHPTSGMHCDDGPPVVRSRSRAPRPSLGCRLMLVTPCDCHSTDVNKRAQPWGTRQVGEGVGTPPGGDPPIPQVFTGSTAKRHMIAETNPRRPPPAPHFQVTVFPGTLSPTPREEGETADPGGLGYPGYANNGAHAKCMRRIPMQGALGSP